MIEIDCNNLSKPSELFLKHYNNAKKLYQNNIEAACLSTCSNDGVPNSRYVNIKYLNDDKFIFFSNYKSVKANDIETNNKASLVFFWNTVNIQIIIQGSVFKIDESSSDEHWLIRSREKRALAISSYQSSPIASYDEVVKNFEICLKSNLTHRPSYWGGYSLAPNYYEIWEGNKNRVNKRHIFKLTKDKWNDTFIQP